MTGLTGPPSWAGPSDDPNDEQFGDVVERVEDVRDDVSDYDAVLAGEPFDRGVVGRKGAAQGPRAIRESLASVKTHHTTGPVGSVGDAGDVFLSVDAGDGLPGSVRDLQSHVRVVAGALHGAAQGPRAIRESLASVKTHHTTGPVGPVGDAGDLFLSVDADDGLPGSVRDLQSHVRVVAGALHGADTLPVFLGGDNSLTFPNCVPLLERGTVGVVNLDAHLDVREVRGDATSGTPYRQLFAAGLDAYACVGTRHFETSTRYHDYVRDRGGEVVTSEAVGEGTDTAAERALEAMGPVDHVYLSLDLDVLDAAAAPGVSAPTPGGITTRECFRILHRLARDERLAGFEVVECAPPLDRDGLTVDAAARAVAHVLAGRQEGEVVA